MTSLKLTVAEVLAALEDALGALGRARRISRDLPSSTVDGKPWGEVRQVVDAALDAADAELTKARWELEP